MHAAQAVAAVIGGALAAIHSTPGSGQAADAAGGGVVGAAETLRVHAAGTSLGVADVRHTASIRSLGVAVQSRGRARVTSSSHDRGAGACDDGFDLAQCAYSQPDGALTQERLRERSAEVGAAYAHGGVLDLFRGEVGDVVDSESADESAGLEVDGFGVNGLVGVVHEGQLDPGAGWVGR